MCAAQSGYCSRETAAKGNIKNEELVMVQDPCDPKNREWANHRSTETFHRLAMNTLEKVGERSEAQNMSIGLKYYSNPRIKKQLFVVFEYID